MFLNDARRHGHAVRAHVGRHRFLYLSLVLHALPLGALGYWDHADDRRVESQRRERLLDAGMRQTEQARLEKRVRDMAQIKSLLEQSAGAGDASGQRPGAANPDDVQASAQPKAPDELLKHASELSRTIEAIERDIKAEQLAKLLKIPKEKALEQLPEIAKLDEAALDARNPAEAAARIAQLEAKAREALERRRQQLEQRHNGTEVTASAAPGAGKPKPASARRAGSSDSSKQDSKMAQAGPGGPGGGDEDGAGTGNADGGSGAGDAVNGRGSGGGGGEPGAPLLAKIAAFTNPDMPDRPTTEYTGGGLQAYYDRGIGRVPEVDAKQMVTGSGRMIGPGGAYANRIYVNRWYVIGPFEGKHGGGLFSNYRHPPEDAVVLDAAYRGKGGRLLKWEYLEMTTYPLIPPTPAENAVYYGYTELMLDKEQDLTMWVGADDDAQLWLNDKLAWKGGNFNKQWFFETIYETANTHVRDHNLSEGKRVVRFRKGRNKLFFKLSNGPTRIYFSLVLTK